MVFVPGFDNQFKRSLDLALQSDSNDKSIPWTKLEFDTTIHISPSSWHCNLVKFKSFLIQWPTWRQKTGYFKRKIVYCLICSTTESWFHCVTIYATQQNHDSVVLRLMQPKEIVILCGQKIKNKLELRFHCVIYIIESWFCCVAKSGKKKPEKGGIPEGKRE